MSKSVRHFQDLICSKYKYHFYDRIFRSCAMPRLNENQRNCAVGRLHASYRMAQNVIARQFSGILSVHYGDVSYNSATL